MSLISIEPRFLWTLPVEGDGRGSGHERAGVQYGARVRKAWPSHLHDAGAGQFGYYDYLYQVARAASASGFAGVYVPWHEAGEDSWIVTSSLAADVPRLTFVPEVQPGFATPVYFAKLTASFQRFAGPRLAWKLDLERPLDVRRAHGEWLEGGEFYARASEFVEATRGVLSAHPFNYEGKFFGVQAGGLRQPLGARPLPLLYTSGKAPSSLAFAIQHADVHLLEASNQAELVLQLEALKAAQKQSTTRSQSRPLQLGLRARVVSRHSTREAQAAFDEQASPGYALVGSHDEVAQAIDALVALGVEHFILHGTPALEEAYRFGEHVFPRLGAKARSQAA